MDEMTDIKPSSLERGFELLPEVSDLADNPLFNEKLFTSLEQTEMTAETGVARENIQTAPSSFSEIQGSIESPLDDPNFKSFSWLPSGLGQKENGSDNIDFFQNKIENPSNFFGLDDPSSIPPEIFDFKLENDCSSLEYDFVQDLCDSKVNLLDMAENDDSYVPIDAEASSSSFSSGMKIEDLEEEEEEENDTTKLPPSSFVAHKSLKRISTSVKSYKSSKTKGGKVDKGENSKRVRPVIHRRCKNMLKSTKSREYGARCEKSSIFECQQCDYTTNNRSNFKNHQLIHGEERMFQCPYCPYRSKQSAGLRAHYKVHSIEKPFQCSFCSYKSKRKQNLVQHLRIHSKEQPFRCEKCSYRSSTKQLLQNHMLWHVSVKSQSELGNRSPSSNEYECLICSKSFPNESELSSHFQTHSDENAVSSTQENEILNREIRKHLTTANLAFKCSQCDFVTLRKCALRNHIKSHENKESYRCNLCEFRCSVGSTMKAHVESHKFDCPKPLYQGIKPGKCSEISNTTNNPTPVLSDTPRHCTENKEAFQCPYCDFKCNLGDILKVHICHHPNEFLLTYKKRTVSESNLEAAESTQRSHKVCRIMKPIGCDDMESNNENLSSYSDHSGSSRPGRNHINKPELTVTRDSHIPAQLHTLWGKGKYISRDHEGKLKDLKVRATVHGEITDQATTSTPHYESGKQFSRTLWSSLSQMGSSPSDYCEDFSPGLHIDCCDSAYSSKTEDCSLIDDKNISEEGHCRDHDAMVKTDYPNGNLNDGNKIDQKLYSSKEQRLVESPHDSKEIITENVENNKDELPEEFCDTEVIDEKISMESCSEYSSVHSGENSGVLSPEHSDECENSDDQAGSTPKPEVCMPKIYACSKCDSSFRKKSSLTNHSRVHSNKVFRCPLCTYTSKFVKPFLTHSRKHAERKRFGCSQCDFTADRKCSLMSHYRSHNYLYMCFHCGFSCRAIKDLEQHSLCHKEGIAIKCTHCDFVSNEYRLLKDHVKQHRNQNLYSCIKCNIGFSDMEKFHQHLEGHFKDNDDNEHIKNPDTENKETKSILQLYLEDRNASCTKNSDVCSDSISKNEGADVFENSNHSTESFNNDQTEEEFIKESESCIPIAEKEITDSTNEKVTNPTTYHGCESINANEKSQD